MDGEFGALGEDLGPLMERAVFTKGTLTLYDAYNRALRAISLTGPGPVIEYSWLNSYNLPAYLLGAIDNVGPGGGGGGGSGSGSGSGGPGSGAGGPSGSGFGNEERPGSPPPQRRAMGPLSEFVRKLMDERKATKASPGRARKLLQDPGSGSGIAVSAGGIARLLTMVSLILEQDADMGRAIDLMVIGSGGDIMDFFTQIGSLLVITGPE
eukprot:1693353-Rhodomonas_salina.2